MSFIVQQSVRCVATTVEATHKYTNFTIIAQRNKKRTAPNLVQFFTLLWSILQTALLLLGFGSSSLLGSGLDLGDGSRIEMFANGSDDYSVNGKWQHFALSVDDVDAAYECALAAGFLPKTAPKTIPIKASPADITIRMAFVIGNDGEQVEFFKEI